MPISTPADSTGGSADMPETPDEAGRPAPDMPEMAPAELEPELPELLLDGELADDDDGDGDDAIVGPLVPRHPVVFVALVGLPLLAFSTYGLSGQGFITAFTAAALVLLAAIDIEHRVLPNQIVFPATAIVLVAQLIFFPDQALEWLVAGLGAALFLALPMIVRRDAMGMGDVKLGLLIGAATGWSVVGAIFLASLAIVPVAIWMLFRDGSIRGATLPFGPFLAFGTLVILFTQ